MKAKAPLVRLHKTGFHADSLPAKILDFMEQQRLGLLELAACTEVVAADCRFNHWFVTEVKTRKAMPPLREEQLLLFLEAHEANAQRCEAAMRALAAGASREDFCKEMAAVLAFLNQRTLVREV